MQSYIEPIHKSINEIKFCWAQESGATSYQIYVGVIPTSLTLLVSYIPDIPSKGPQGLGKVVYDVGIDIVRTALSLASTVNFGNKVFYFSIIYLDSTGTPSSLADSTIVEVPPVGIIPKLMKDDPTTNRHGYVFNDSLQRWTKMMGSSSGAVIVDAADFYKTNLTIEYTYDGTNLSTIKSYPTDSTITGSPAKLTTYTYSSGQISKIVISDSTV